MLTALSISLAIVAVALCVAHLLSLIDHESVGRPSDERLSDDGVPEQRVPDEVASWVPTAYSLSHPPRPTTAHGRAELELRRYLELGEIDDEEYHRRLDELTGRRRPAGGRPN